MSCYVPSDNCLLLGALSRVNPIDRLSARLSVSEGPRSRFSTSIGQRQIADEQRCARAPSQWSPCAATPTRSMSDYCMSSCWPCGDRTACYNCGSENCCDTGCCVPVNDNDLYENKVDIPVCGRFVNPVNFKLKYGSCGAPFITSARYDWDGRREYYRDEGRNHWMIVPPGRRFRTSYPAGWDPRDGRADRCQYDEKRIRDARSEWRAMNDRFGGISTRYPHHTTSKNIITDMGKHVVLPPRSFLQPANPCTDVVVSDNEYKLQLPEETQGLDCPDTRPKMLVLTEAGSDNKCGFPKTLILWEPEDANWEPRDENINVSSNPGGVVPELNLVEAESSAVSTDALINVDEDQTEEKMQVIETHKIKDLITQLSVLDCDLDVMEEVLFKLLSRDGAHEIGNTPTITPPIVIIQHSSDSELIETSPRAGGDNEREEENLNQNEKKHFARATTQPRIRIKEYQENVLDNLNNSFNSDNFFKKIISTVNYIPQNIPTSMKQETQVNASTSTSTRKPFHPQSRCLYPKTIFVNRTTKPLNYNSKKRLEKPEKLKSSNLYDLNHILQSTSSSSLDSDQEQENTDLQIARKSKDSNIITFPYNIEANLTNRYYRNQRKFSKKRQAGGEKSSCDSWTTEDTVTDNLYDELEHQQFPLTIRIDKPSNISTNTETNEFEFPHMNTNWNANETDKTPVSNKTSKSSFSYVEWNRSRSNAERASEGRSSAGSEDHASKTASKDPFKVAFDLDDSSSGDSRDRNESKPSPRDSILNYKPAEKKAGKVSVQDIEPPPPRQSYISELRSANPSSVKFDDAELYELATGEEWREVRVDVGSDGGSRGASQKSSRASVQQGDDGSKVSSDREVRASQRTSRASLMKDEVETDVKYFTESLIDQLYYGIKAKTDRNLEEDPAIAPDQLEEMKVKVDEETKACVLLLLVEHMTWLIKQDLDVMPDDENWFKDVTADMMDDYIELIVSNITLVAHNRAHDRSQAKSYVAASNCFVNFNQMFNQLDPQ